MPSLITSMSDQQTPGPTIESHSCLCEEELGAEQRILNEEAEHRFLATYLAGLEREVAQQVCLRFPTSMAQAVQLAVTIANMFNSLLPRLTAFLAQATPRKVFHKNKKCVCALIVIRILRSPASDEEEDPDSDPTPAGVSPSINGEIILRQSRISQAKPRMAAAKNPAPQLLLPAGSRNQQHHLLVDAYCYMWHKAIARRGSNGSASCDYHFLKSQPKYVKDVTFYSDTIGVLLPVFGVLKLLENLTLFYPNIKMSDPVPSTSDKSPATKAANPFACQPTSSAQSKPKGNSSRGNFCNRRIDQFREKKGVTIW
ncbi:hypothetical protein LSTR_LSTR001391 [Laodelphax striatellus]|uniref:Uncharacterized protein n=1 Tax=Laodelphax striatellus TaxID=195883 RepID=A0A482XA36_LAOST|nr:hypothetical protein LSTR_LSTR001391 [Laodelphax striatellus]